MPAPFHARKSRILGLVVIASIGLGIFPKSTGFASPNYEYLDLFAKVLHIVQTSYVEEVDSKKLIEGAIKGMLASLDPHSSYLPAEQYREMQVDTVGKFDGLGIEVTVQEGYLTVVTPIEDTPAFHAGIEPGDRIVAIEDKVKRNKKDTKGLTLVEAVSLMRGDKGSKVILHVTRKGGERSIPIEIARGTIKVVSIKGGLIEPDYGWARITSFQANTARDLRNKIEALQKDNGGKPLRGVVLDLRSNPGGLLEEAVSVSGLFLEKLPIVSTIGRNRGKKEVEFSRGDAPFKDLKLVTLVNESSASASEIVAGALQDHKRSLIVGKTTFGKGSVQSVLDLDNNAGLKLTVARYYTPNGRSIQGKGIVPDVEVDRLDVALIEKARKGKAMREADLEGHLVGENETKDEDSAKIERGPKDKEEGDAERRPIRERNGKKLRVDDPKELVKTDFQLQQSLSYLKVWQVLAPTPTLGPAAPAAKPARNAASEK